MMAAYCGANESSFQSNLHNQLLAELHEGHVGVCRFSKKFCVVARLDRDIEVVAAMCDKCKLTASMPATAPWHPWRHPYSPGTEYMLDFGEWNQKHFIVVVDAFSKWPEVQHMPSSTTAGRTIEVLRWSGDLGPLHLNIWNAITCKTHTYS